ncbi:hypothetical protein BC669P2_00032 [Bacteroides phage BC669P2]|nr:hypothetical protein BC669P2_00032 [Bacteroides phage BC669P2]
MKITIPVAGVELQGVTNQTVIYPRQLPVWPTRPMMIKIYPDKISGVGQTVTVAVTDQSSAVHTFELPYEDVIDFDMSFACSVMARADRQKSTELTAGSSILFLSNTSAGAQQIALGVFHCDLTYWHTIPGNQASLPEPPKIKMPGQDVDIYYPFATAPGVTFPVVAEPADDAPAAAIMPTTYTLGKTIDVRYIKKLAIKDVWGAGVDHVIEYENRNWNRANEDDALLCALRVRWNMQNGEWFWDAFKNFFWSNNFNYIRGLGGATEQADVTVNMEYGPEKYAVYQQLMTSSQIIMELNMPGINQYQYKVFRAEVVSDSGARWSGSTRTYRQQVRFRTMELQDNYISPVLPDSPAAIPVQFNASSNPWSMTYTYSNSRWINITCNSAWEVQSEPGWLTVTNGATLLTPNDFEQGTIGFAKGKTWDECKAPQPNLIRLKRTFETMDEAYRIITGLTGYDVQFFYLDDNDRMVGSSGRDSLAGRANIALAKRVGLQLNKTGLLEPITPADITAINAYFGKRYHQFPVGTSNLTVTVQANTGAQRTANLVLKSLAGAATYTIPVTQLAGA